VILESATPSRLLTASPPEAPIKRCGLAEAIAEIKVFLKLDSLTLVPRCA
jgi:ATP-dependent DNA helicase DinG